MKLQSKQRKFTLLFLLLFTISCVLQPAYALNSQITVQSIYEGDPNTPDVLNVPQEPRFGFVINMENDTAGHVQAQMILSGDSLKNQELFAKIYADSDDYINSEKNTELLNTKYSNRLVYYETTPTDKMYKVATTTAGMQKISPAYSYVSNAELMYDGDSNSLGEYHLKSSTVIFGTADSKIPNSDPYGLISRYSLRDETSYSVDLICYGQDIKALIIHNWNNGLRAPTPTGNGGSSGERGKLLPEIDIPSSDFGFLIDISPETDGSYECCLLTKKGVKNVKAASAIKCDIKSNLIVIENIGKIKEKYLGKLIYYRCNNDILTEIYAEESGLQAINSDYRVIRGVEMQYSKSSNTIGNIGIDANAVLLASKEKKVASYADASYSYYWNDYAPILEQDLDDNEYYAVDYVYDNSENKIVAAMFDGTVFLPALDSQLFVFNEVLTGEDNNKYICGLQNGQYVEYRLADEIVVYDFMGHIIGHRTSVLNKGTVIQMSTDADDAVDFCRILYDPLKIDNWSMPAQDQNNTNTALIDNEGIQRARGFVKYGEVQALNSSTITYSDNNGEINGSEQVPTCTINKFFNTVWKSSLSDLQTNATKGTDNDDKLFIYKYDGHLIGALIVDEYGDNRLSGTQVQVGQLPEAGAYLRFAVGYTREKAEDSAQPYFIVAFYQNTGTQNGSAKLKHIKIIKSERSLNVGETTNLEQVVQVPEGADFAKAFLVSGFNTMRPISSAKW